MTTRRPLFAPAQSTERRPLFAPARTPAEKRLFRITEKSRDVTVDEILARPDAFVSDPITGRKVFNAAVVTSEEAEDQNLVRELQQRAGEKRAPAISPVTAAANVGEAFQRDVVQPAAGAALFPFSRQVRKGFAEQRREGADIIGAFGEAERGADFPTARVNLLPGQGVPLPGGRRFDEINLGVKGAVELAADPLNLLPVVGFGKEIMVGMKALKGASRTALESAIRNAPRTAEGIRAAVNKVGERFPDVKRVLTDQTGAVGKGAGKGIPATEKAALTRRVKEAEAELADITAGVKNGKWPKSLQESSQRKVARYREAQRMARAGLSSDEVYAVAFDRTPAATTPPVRPKRPKRPARAPEAAPVAEAAAPEAAMTLDEAVERAIAQGKTPSTYVIPGTEVGIDPVTVARLKKQAFANVKRLREKVKELGPRAGNLRLELMRAESSHGELVLLDKQWASVRAARREASPAAPTPPVRPKRPVAARAAREPIKQGETVLTKGGGTAVEVLDASDADTLLVRWPREDLPDSRIMRESVMRRRPAAATKPVRPVTERAASAAPENVPSRNVSVYQRPLAGEALKYDTFDDFERAFIRQIKHGRYYHVTDNPNFTIDPLRGPRDLSSLAGEASPAQGKLMITSHLENWTDFYKGERQYVAIIDMSDVPKEQYWSVNRGFGNEFWVDNPSRAKVVKVVSVQQAKRDSRLHQKALPQSSEELRELYNKVKGTASEPIQPPGGVVGKEAVEDIATAPSPSSVTGGEPAVPAPFTGGQAATPPVVRTPPRAQGRAGVGGGEPPRGAPRVSATPAPEAAGLAGPPSSPAAPSAARFARPLTRPIRRDVTREIPKAETADVAGIARGGDAPLSTTDNVAEFARGADPSGGGSGTPPRRPTDIGGVPSGAGGEPDDLFERVISQATRGEKIDRTLLRRHEAAITTAENEARILMDEASSRLRAAGYGVVRQGRWVPRDADIPVMDSLFEALHNPSKVSSGDVRIPRGLESEYARLREMTDWEEAMRIDFDPEMATVEDYFYRGWIVPKEGVPRPPGGVARGRLGTTPAFKKTRVDASYREMRDAGFEPVSWNPFEQWRISRLQGVRYRQQMQLIDHLKKMDMAVTDASGLATEGWRTPRVGPAFEGKVFATTDAAGEPVAMYTRRFVVPDQLAGRLESMYGVMPDLGNVHIGNKSLNLRKAIDAAVFIPKRFKLFGSLFQQMDFLTRAYIGGWSGMIDAMIAGKPIPAMKSLAVIPRTTARVIEANFRPSARLAMRRQLNSTTPIVAGRKGIHLRGIMEAGLSTIDTTILPAGLDKTARVVAEEMGLLGNRAVRRAIGSLESSMRRGLFEGTYPAAQIETIRNSIAPRIVRLYGKGMSDEALNGMIAVATNKMFSTIPASQSVIQNRPLREILRRVFFSMGESEGLLRQAFGALKGPEKLFWAEHWLGAYVGLIALANVIHYATTGEPLPSDRWSPVSKDSWGPLPIGYNAKFAAPDIPLRGKEGLRVTLDLVGQMDTAFRLLDPVSFLSSRESVPIRAFVTQTTERDFYGRPIDQVGPGGVYSRTANLINDMFAPIGIGQAAAQIGLEQGKLPPGLVPVSERGLGTRGQLVQATGLNLRAQYLRQAWRGDLKEYNDIPTDRLELGDRQLSRTDYRDDNPDVDAKLFITGQVTSLRTQNAVQEAARLIDEGKIDPKAISGIQDRKERLKKAAEAGRSLEANEVDDLILMLGQGGAPTPSRTAPPRSTPGGGLPRRTLPSREPWARPSRQQRRLPSREPVGTR